MCCTDDVGVYRGADKFLSQTKTETSYSDRRFWVSYILFITIIGGILVLCIYVYVYIASKVKKSKYIPRQAKVALGVPGRLRPRIFSTFGTTTVAGRQPNAPAAFIPGEIPDTHLQRLGRPQGTWFCRKEPRKKSHVTPPGIDPGLARLVAQCLNHYATPGPHIHVTRLASKEIFSPSNKIHREVGRTKDLSAPRYCEKRRSTASKVLA